MEIGDRLGMPSSTVHAVLVRCRINRLTHIDRASATAERTAGTPQQARKLGKVPNGGGWRYAGDVQ